MLHCDSLSALLPSIKRQLSAYDHNYALTFKPASSYFAEYFPAQVPSHKDVPSKSELDLDGEKTKTTSTDDATKTKTPSMKHKATTTST
ncbi:hypothetical protein AALP_AA8G009000 [Arabis alpina]|uniref:Uncharacterized protein n=1 Tax=Arabis alpina TaxID=50452 RepID=A0A087G462_ARAAL|nr:hypothetical protein AALP_AA8G009000 [Arabis alpina]